MIGQIDIDVNYNGNQPFTIQAGNFRQLNVMAGANGVGKSMMNKWNWLITFAMQAYKLSLALEPQSADKEFRKFFSELIPLTFDILDLISGYISVSDTEKKIFRLDIVLEDNNVTYFNIDIKEPQMFSVGKIQNIQYNSGNTRTFDQYEKFIGISKLTGINIYKEIEDFQKVQDFYKIYEVVWFEGMKHKMRHWIDNGIDKDIQDRINNSAEVLSLGDNPKIYLKDGSIYLKTDIRDCKISSLSSGSQSYLMLVIFA